MDGIVEATHTLTTAGQRAAYVPAELPGSFEDNSPTDFAGSAYEQVRNAASGIAHAWDAHVWNIASVDRNPQWQEFAPPYRNKKLQDAHALVAKESLKTVTRCETIAENATREAEEIKGQLTASDKVDSVAASVCLNAYQVLTAEKRVLIIHELARMLADDSGATSDERRQARQYLSAIVATNRFAGLLSDESREFVTEILGRTSNPREWQRMKHLALAGRAIKQTAARARELISR